VLSGELVRLTEGTLTTVGVGPSSNIRLYEKHKQMNKRTTVEKLSIFKNYITSRDVT